MNVIDMLFGSNTNSKADITVGELQAIVTELKAIKTAKVLLENEIVALKEENEALKNFKKVRVDANLKGIDTDGVINISFEDLEKANITGDVAIDVNDLLGLINSNISYGKEVKTLNRKISEVSNKLETANQKVLNATTLSKINTVPMTGILQELGIHIDTKI